MNVDYLLAIASFTACVLLAPVIYAVAMRYGWYDMPGELKIHRAPTPRLGGIALMGGVFVSVVFALNDPRPVVAVLIILATVWAVGLLDDLKGTSPYLRLAVDFGCGAALWLLGWKLHWFSNPCLDFLATVAFLTFAINAMNMLDGMDGLALTVSGIASIGFILLLSGQPAGFASGLAWSLAAVCAAMFLFNRPPAQIFIGDSGSTLLGASLAFLALDWVRTGAPAHSSVVPLLFLGLPLADALAAVIRRLRGMSSPFAGDRRHFYDLLLRRGWSVHKILCISGFTTAVFVMLSVTASRDRVGLWLPLFGCVGLCGFLGMHLGSFESETPVVSESVPSAQLEAQLKQSLNEE
ncbi:MAG TPA: MraY family glycosyltransferase, partial [Candidatus Acidoferrum sp.]|jgi:UDP-GlcNAc:undecaprenyl-phosphate GlcNAc-1-phosphate transferase